MIWWRDAVCYEMYPRSFADSDGDGTGDLPGITRHLDHVRDLGADAIWITPFYPSPLADGGYDIADHTAVADDLGTLADFGALTVRAHAMGLKVIVDVVPNHSSDTHPWFREALAAGPGSAARARYLFRTGQGPDGALPPNDWESAFGGPAWTRVPDGEWYLHLHAPEQPDFDWRDPDVRAEFARVLRFWLDQGVDGFRIDVAHALFKADGLPDAGPGQHRDPARNHLMPYYDQEELHPLYREWRTLLDTHPAPPGAVAPGERVLVAESAVFEPTRLARYVRADEMQQAFNFAFLEAPWQATTLRRVIDESLAATAAVDAPVTWVMSSHDAPRPATRLGGELRARSAALLMLALPGAVYLYQGEELGLPQADLPDDRIRDPLWHRSGGTDRGRDGARVPIPWHGDRPPYGFTTAAPEACWLPQPEGWGRYSVAAQREDPDSVLSLYRRALRLRREHPVAAHGGLRWHSPADASYLAFSRGELTCVVNLGPEALDLARTGSAGRPVLASAALLDGGELPADACVWLSTAVGGEEGGPARP
ncbi:glycoside hydrolase family 13 protein [Streptomyces sp. NPDC006875]|uniref:glycoside hydrolase family 13 protein n=1 Tax=Streptomyces sp. NPDC006875 TaxID=3154781 RepID=UPI00340D7394